MLVHVIKKQATSIRKIANFSQTLCIAIRVNSILGNCELLYGDNETVTGYLFVLMNFKEKNTI